MREQSPASGVSIGGLTVLVIFTVLCLTIFSVISLSSAQADRRLSDKNVEQTVRYYEADGKAEEQLRRMDLALKQAATGSPEENLFWQRAAGALAALEEPSGSLEPSANQYSFEVPVSEVLALRAVIQIRYKEGIPGWSVLEWKTYSTLDYEIDESITLWQGE